MNIVLFSHPDFIKHQSMPRFTRMLLQGMEIRGHKVEVILPKGRLFKFAILKFFKKWFGYIDQFILFPLEFRRRLKFFPSDTLFVFTDHALGPWVSLVADRPHVIHCHDFLAQQSALGEISENPTGWTGRLYQAYIRRGFSKGTKFISVSKKSKEDLHRFISHPIKISEVIYNGLNPIFTPQDPFESRKVLQKLTGIFLEKGFILHVGGNQWYKNRKGVIKIYNEWRTSYDYSIPLLLIGEIPDKTLLQQQDESSYKKDIYFLNDLEDKFLHLAYCGALVLLFPSLAEGFGWPIAEAMASGCIVITTNEPPMTEVAGNSGFFIPRQPLNEMDIKYWTIEVAQKLSNVLKLSCKERNNIIETGLKNVSKFNYNDVIDQIEAVYHKILLTCKND